MSPTAGSTWREWRRGLGILALLIGAMSLYCFFQGRPGDFEAGVIGGVLGGSVAAVVVSVEWLGRRLVRRPDTATAAPLPSNSAPDPERERTR